MDPLLVLAARRAAAGLLAVALASCTGASGSDASTPSVQRPEQPAAEPTEETHTPATLEPEVTEPVFVDGPAIAPASELASWLSSHKGSLLRLPLVIEVRSYSVGPAWIGMTAEDAPDDAVWVKLDQTALGVGLTERLVPLCAETPTRCAVWIPGYLAPTLKLPGPPGFDGPSVPGEPKKEPFSVREVVALVQDGDTPHVKVVRR